MSEIKVTHIQANVYRVEIQDKKSRSIHDVTASSADVQRYGGNASPERLIEASFEFLLKREPKESILRSFELPVIEHYFPEYPTEIRKRLS